MIVILGGGISALSAAFELQKAGKEFVLFEQQNRVGGKIASIVKEGCILEKGPNTVLINNKETLGLIKDLKLSDELIFPEEEAVKCRYILKEGTPEAIPTSLKQAIKSNLFHLSTLVSILKEPFVSKKQTEEEESLADFVRRRLGQQILDDYITPFVTGIYAGDPEQMSINYTLNILKEAEETKGSIIRGMMKIMKAKKATNEKTGLPKQKIFSFSNGLQHLIDQLAVVLGDKIQLNTTIRSIELLKEKNEYQIHYNKGEEMHSIQAKQVICCLPAPLTAKVCNTLSPTLSKRLHEINYVPAVSVHFCFPKNAIGFSSKAFGILSRKAEKVPFLGILFNSRFFPHVSGDDKEVITVIGGGKRYPELIEKEDQVIIDELKSSLKEILNIKVEPDFAHLSKWKQAIPQYELGYGRIENEIDTFLKEQPNFYIAANYYKGISVSDCIKNGKLVADRILT